MFMLGIAFKLILVFLFTCLISFKEINNYPQNFISVYTEAQLGEIAKDRFVSNIYFISSFHFVSFFYSNINVSDFEI